MPIFFKGAGPKAGPSGTSRSGGGMEESSFFFF